MSSFGTLFKVTTYGESHCKSVGCIVDGCPPGMSLTEADIQPQLTVDVQVKVNYLPQEMKKI